MKSRQSVNIDQVTIVGGTHGNELLGPYFLERIHKADLYSDVPFTVSTLLANPEAFDKSVRFIDHDLNHSFSESLSGSKLSSIAIQQARPIKKQFDSYGKHQFVIDLHSTTANMGITLIVRENDLFNLHAASYVQQQIPEVRLLISDTKKQQQNLNSLNDWGLCVEVGPTPNGVLRHDQFKATEKVVNQLIKFLSLCKTREEPKLPESIDVFKVIETFPFPRLSSGKLAGMIHEEFQDKDYRLLEPNTPIFKTFEGKDISYEGQPGYPVFINEAAYYQEDVAFMLTERVTISLHQLR